MSLGSGPEQAVGNPTLFNWTGDGTGSGPAAGVGVVQTFSDNSHVSSGHGGFSVGPTSVAGATEGFAGNNPAKANAQANHHYAVDMDKWREGDCGWGQFVFHRKQPDGMASFPSDPRHQSFEHKGLARLAYNMNWDPELVRELSSKTLAEAANVFRFKGIQQNAESTMVSQGGDSMAEAVVTVAGRVNFVPNVFFATSRVNVQEMDSLWFIFCRFNRTVTKDNSNFLLWDSSNDEENETPAEFQQRQRQLEEEEEKALSRSSRSLAGDHMDEAEDSDREEDEGKDSADISTLHASAAADPLLAMYASMARSNVHKKPGTHETMPKAIWNPLCGKTDGSPIYWHYWIPVACRGEAPPDPALYGGIRGVPVHVGMVEHVMRGENNATATQVKAAREVAFNRKNGSEYLDAQAKLDMIQIELRIR